MKIREKVVKSKSGCSYRLEFDDRKQECKVTCLNATGFCAFFKQDIYRAMSPLTLEVVSAGMESIVYKCPAHMNQRLIQAIKES